MRVLLSCCTLRPSEIDAGHLIEACIVRFIKFLEPFVCARTNERMVPAFAFAQAMRHRAGLRFDQARKPFRCVEVKVFFCDDAFQAQEMLHTTYFKAVIKPQNANNNKKPYTCQKCVSGVLFVRFYLRRIEDQSFAADK